MKIRRNLITTATTGLFMTALALSFNACTEQSPFQPGDEKKVTENESQENTLTILTKKGGSNKPSTQEAPYPQYDSQLIRFHAPTNHYRGGNLDLPNGASFNIQGGALIPPPEIPWGEEVTITMLCEKDTVNNELTFTFGPSGCQFGSGARIFLDYKDLGIDKALLYYIDEKRVGKLSVPSTMMS